MIINAFLPAMLTYEDLQQMSDKQVDNLSGEEIAEILDNHVFDDIYECEAAYEEYGVALSEYDEFRLRWADRVDKDLGV